MHRSKREIEELVAEIAPRPDVVAVVRKLPERPAHPIQTDGEEEERVSLQLRPDGAGVPAPQGRPQGAGALAEPLRPDAVPSRAVVEPLAPARYRVQFTANAEFRDKLERLQTLMRSEVPDGDLAAIIEKAVTEKLERLETRRHGRTSVPRKRLSESELSSGSRHIPAAVRRTVCERDGNRCRYVDARGRRCPERQRLEYHHRHPYALGGDRGPNNICLMCRAHNLYLAEQDYGHETMLRYRGPGGPMAGNQPGAERRATAVSGT